MSDENTAFKTYLDTHGLTASEVAKHCRVRSMTVWNILKNKPVTPAHAAAVRAGLYQLTGVLYKGPIATEKP